jgi:hypothetical protein
MDTAVAPPTAAEIARAIDRECAAVPFEARAADRLCTVR